MKAVYLLCVLAIVAGLFYVAASELPERETKPAVGIPCEQTPVHRRYQHR